jgi:opacity protein-like surface antigen
VTLRKALMASAAIVSFSAATSAEAAQPYASLFGGLSFLQKQKLAGHNFTRTTTSLTVTSEQSVDTSFKTGFVLGGNAGIEWGSGLRTEVELAFRQNNSHKSAHLKTHYGYGFYTTSKTGEGESEVTHTFFTHVTADAQDNDVPANLRLRAWSLMANAWYDFDLGLPITPYVGGGIGMAMVKVSGSLGRTNPGGTTDEGTVLPRTSSIVRLHERNDTVFAWQLGVGASMPISDTTKLFVDYRYFAADDAHLKLEPGFNGGSVDADFNSHSIMAGIRFNF